MERKYCAFISYRHVSPDQDVAGRLHTAIETYGIPGSIRSQTGRKKMGKVFRDKEELPLSADLGADIESALDASDWLICICSPRYLESRWCLRELEYFCRKKGRDRVLAVLAEGTPETSFPPMLLEETRQDGELRLREPLAADLRSADRKRFRGETLRLLAPMLGVSFDDLKRRARQRRLRQALAACAALLVLAGGIGAYAAVNHARNERLRLEAEEQHRLAQEQAQLAEEQSRLAQEQQALAQERQRLAEEEARRAEEERVRAVESSIGELLERASAELGSEARRNAASTLLEALAISNQEGGLRREEILSLLRRDLYIAPFAAVSSFTGRNVRLDSIVPAPAGNLAVGFENGNQAALIDLDAGDIRYKVQTGDTQAGGLCFSPDGERFLALCDQGRLVTVWNTADGSEAFRCVSRENQPYHIANACFWRDGEHLLVQDLDKFYLVSADGQEKLLYTMGDQQDWYTPNQNYYTLFFGAAPQEIITTSGTGDYMGMEMLTSADGSRILVTGLDGSTGTLILDENGDCVTPLWGMPGTAFEKYSLSPDGKLAACVSYLGFLAWWDGETGDLLGIDSYDNSSGAGFCPIAFSPAGDRLAVVVSDTLRVYDAQTGDLLIAGTVSSSNIVPSAAFSADGNWLFVTSQDLYIIDARTGALFERLESGSTVYFNNALEVGDWLFVSRSNGATELRCMPGLSNVEHQSGYDGTLCEDYDPGRTPAGTVPVLKSEHQFSATFLQTTPLKDLSPRRFYDREGTRAALYYPDGAIELFDLEGDGTPVSVISQLDQNVMAFGMTGRWLAVCANGGYFMLYDLEEDQAVRIWQFAEYVYDRFAFSADGALLMARRTTGPIDVYEIAEARLLFTLRSTEAFTDFAFAADGSAAVAFTASGAEVADLWTDEAALLSRAEALTGK